MESVPVYPEPALQILRNKRYKGAQQEFLRAHEHYKKGNDKEALNESLKAFESVMKTICDKHGWSYNENSTAKKLIEICFENKLIPDFWQSYFNSLRNLLESSIPTGRNKLSSHGQGTKITDIPDYLVAFILNMTAAAIVFLVAAESRLN